MTETDTYLSATELRLIKALADEAKADPEPKAHECASGLYKLLHMYALSMTGNLPMGVHTLSEMFDAKHNDYMLSKARDPEEYQSVYSTTRDQLLKLKL